MPFKDTEARKAYARAYYKSYNKRPHVAARIARYAANEWKSNAEFRGKRWQRWLRTNYDLTIEQFDARLIQQSGRCAICSEPLQIVHVDHDHVTNKVRALLCELCNKGLGQFKDSAERLRSAAEYLESFRLTP